MARPLLRGEPLTKQLSHSDVGPETVEAVLARMRTGIAEGRVPARIFSDPDIFELEKKKLFAKAWSFLAHESEIPNPGDYVTRYLLNNNLIVSRDEHGVITANLNLCRHRGNQICKVDMGNTSHFRCAYHGWVYKNSGALIGVPYLKESFDADFDKRKWDLHRVRTESYAGLIFGTLDPDAEPLADFLGDFRFYLDLFLKQGPGGSEVYGPPARWLISANWKVMAENFCGDGYHTPVTHGFAIAAGYFPSSGASHSQGWSVHIPGRGHGIGLGHTPGMPPFFGFPAELVDKMRLSLTAEQMEVFSKVRTAVGTVFPNVSFLVQPFSRIPGDPGVRLSSMRFWRPIAHNQVEVYSWCLVPKDASKEFREEAYRAYVLAFGQAGAFEQDDLENWTNLTEQVSGTIAQELDFPYAMGLSREPVADWPGPGVAISPYITENNFRNQWLTWLDYLQA
jgi:phenylpropionate dioxygenase-like ring-hydroxylating dioxygenase large terminal subunit